MLERENTIKRVYVGQEYDEVMELPSLVEIQLASFERFLQKNQLENGEPLNLQGLEEVFQAVFPIESPNGDMILEYTHYSLEVSGSKISEAECKQKGLTYAIPIKAKINLYSRKRAKFVRRTSIWVISPL